MDSVEYVLAPCAPLLQTLRLLRSLHRAILPITNHQPQTDELHCGDPDPNGLAPCQVGFGLCQIVPPPSCDPDPASANGRSIGYYQSSNTNDRLCNRIGPIQIVTTGLTHLYFAFAEIDHTSFAIVVANAEDEDRHVEFNKLQASSLKTWIAIGGFDFNDPGPTRTTW